MKRYVNSNQVHNTRYLLKIIVDVYSDENVAAATYIKDPSMKRSKKMSEDQVEELDDIIDSLISIINRYKFSLISCKQSPFSYTYYIVFTPTDDNGDEWEYSAVIQLEIRDHSRNANTEGGWVSNDRYVKLFHVGDKTCFDTSGIISEFKKICSELKKGDYSSLEPIPE